MRGQSIMVQAIRISILYFLCVFAAGFVLGTVRVLFVVDFIGERNAELMETPVMMIVCWVVARHLVAKNKNVLNPSGAWLVGIVALLLLLSVEFTVVLTLRGLSLNEYFANRDVIAGAAYLVALVWYALAPVVFYKAGSHSTR
ncbi:hypothetical protein [Neptunicella marina]|uniref:Uncharacterized protein n=1 Tax=Neptunicella marina TaxID=2125989 RepID=A0A8J6IXA3_9ALTE|nr:hypothetical protein [Neptunicella marina]MBC3767141.1 hypothetical protein [Neptunicella marina]